MFTVSLTSHSRIVRPGIRRFFFVDERRTHTVNQGPLLRVRKADMYDRGQYPAQVDTFRSLIAWS